MTSLRRQHPRSYIDDPGTRVPEWDPGTLLMPFIHFMDPDDVTYVGPPERLKDAKGRFVSRAAMTPEEADEFAWEVAVQRKHDELFGRANPRGIAALGTHRSKRKASDARREAARLTACEVCGNELPKGMRSDRTTCSAACKQRLYRMRKAATVVAMVAKGSGDRVRYRSAARIERVVDRELSPLTEALIEATVAVWGVPMPDGYPDEADWRLQQAYALARLARDERRWPVPSVARFNRRARSYIRNMERLTNQYARETQKEARRGR